MNSRKDVEQGYDLKVQQGIYNTRIAEQGEFGCRGFTCRWIDGWIPDGDSRASRPKWLTAWVIPQHHTYISGTHHLKLLFLLKH